MVKMPVLSGERVVKLLLDSGFVQVGQKGSHVKLKEIHDEKKRPVIVSLHKELASGTLASVLRQAGMTIEELLGKK